MLSKCIKTKCLNQRNLRVCVEKRTYTYSLKNIFQYVIMKLIIRAAAVCGRSSWTSRRAIQIPRITVVREKRSNAENSVWK